MVGTEMVGRTRSIVARNKSAASIQRGGNRDIARQLNDCLQ